MIIFALTNFADMVKLVDMPDLGSGAARRVGSSPIIRTKKASQMRSFFYISNSISLQSSHQSLSLNANGITPDSNTFSWNFLMSNFVPILVSAFYDANCKFQ